MTYITVNVSKVIVISIIVIMNMKLLTKGLILKKLLMMAFFNQETTGSKSNLQNLV